MSSIKMIEFDVRPRQAPIRSCTILLPLPRSVGTFRFATPNGLVADAMGERGIKVSSFETCNVGV